MDENVTEALDDEIVEQADEALDPQSELLDALTPEDTEEEVEPEAEPLPETFKVQTGNGEEEVTLEELTKGYLRQSDYTRKAQSLAEERGSLQDQLQQYGQQVQQAAQQRIEQLEALVTNVIAPEMNSVDWVSLASNDPAEYVRMQARQQQIATVFNAIAEQKQGLIQSQKAEQDRRNAEFTQKSVEYLKQVAPDFGRDQYQEALSIGKQLGFSDNELSNTIDGRAIYALHVINLQAKELAKYQAKKPVAMQKAVQAQKPVKPSTNEKPQRNKSAEDRLRKHGRIEDLTAFL